jgi:hypothetical protein
LSIEPKVISGTTGPQRIRARFPGRCTGKRPCRLVIVSATHLSSVGGYFHSEENEQPKSAVSPQPAHSSHTQWPRDG